MTQNLPEPWMAGAVLALVCLLCCGALRWVEEPPPQHSGRPLHDTALAEGLVVHNQAPWTSLHRGTSSWRSASVELAHD